MCGAGCAETTEALANGGRGGVVVAWMEEI